MNFFCLQLRKDFEEDQQQAVSRAVAASQRDLERVRRQTEEKVKEQYMEELKKLAQKHKSEISQTKKKQWVSHHLKTFPPLAGRWK